MNNTIKVESCIHKYACKNKEQLYVCLNCSYFESHSKVYQDRIKNLEAKLGLAIVALCKISSSKCNPCSNISEKALDDIEKI